MSTYGGSFTISIIVIYTYYTNTIKLKGVNIYMTKKYDSILLDIDNTITELQPTLDLMAKEFNREPVSAEDVLDFKLARAYNLTSEEEKSFWTGYEIELAERSELAVERVQNMLDTYTHEDTTIFVVTMRPQKSYEATFNWLRANNINFDTLICLGQESKVDYALHFGIEAIFEDNADLFEEVKRKELEDKFDLFVVDYPYNKTVDNAVRLDRKTGKEINK